MGFYMEPWLWYDGDQDGGFNPFDWEAKIVNRMNQPAPVTINFWGDYSPNDGSGTVYAQFRNDSTTTINGIALLVITEDSLYYFAPNGAEWHNHVARDYLPDQNGTPVSIAPGDSVVVSQPFTTDAVWNDGMCKILAWVQDTVMQADSTYEIWQGGIVKVTELSVEERQQLGVSHNIIQSHPNPGSEQICFTFALPSGMPYSITLYDVNGRFVKNLQGIACHKIEQEIWDCTNDHGDRVISGVYLYRFVNSSLVTTGKVVVQ